MDWPRQSSILLAYNTWSILSEWIRKEHIST